MREDTRVRSPLSAAEGSITRKNGGRIEDQWWCAALYTLGH